MEGVEGQGRDCIRYAHSAVNGHIRKHVKDCHVTKKKTEKKRRKAYLHDGRLDASNKEEFDETFEAEFFLNIVYCRYLFHVNGGKYYERNILRTLSTISCILSVIIDTKERQPYATKELQRYPDDEKSRLLV